MFDYEERPGYSDAQEIKEKLAKNPGYRVKMKCFNHRDVREIMSHLSYEERERVIWVWMEFTPVGDYDFGGIGEGPL